jgi:hypothetical protein
MSVTMSVAAPIGAAQHGSVHRQFRLPQRTLSAASRYNLPIFFVGDFNNRDKAFCELTSGGVLTAAAGGSNSNRCIAPGYKGIDWIFGSQQTRWAGHSAVRRGVVGRISDHPLVVARVEHPVRSMGGSAR